MDTLNILKRSAPSSPDHVGSSLVKKRCLFDVSPSSRVPGFSTFPSFTGVNDRNSSHGLHNTMNFKRRKLGHEPVSELNEELSFTLAQFYKNEIDRLKAEACKKVSEMGEENQALRHVLSNKETENNKLQKEAKILKVGFSHLNSKLQSCKCREMMSTIERQQEVIKNLEWTTYALRNEVKRLEGGANPASRWEGKNNGDGHVY